MRYQPAKDNRFINSQYPSGISYRPFHADCIIPASGLLLPQTGGDTYVDTFPEIAYRLVDTFSD